MGVDDRVSAIGQAAAGTNGSRDRIGQIVRQGPQHLVDQRPLHPCGDRSGLLVDRHDPPGVHRRVVVDLATHVAAHDFILRIRKLQTGPPILEGPEEDDLLPRMKDVRRNA